MIKFLPGLEKAPGYSNIMVETNKKPFQNYLIKFATGLEKALAAQRRPGQVKDR